MIIPGPARFQYATYTRHVGRGEAAREKCTIHVRFGGVGRRRPSAVGHGSSPPARQQHDHTQHHEITFPKHDKYNIRIN